MSFSSQPEATECEPKAGRVTVTLTWFVSVFRRIVPGSVSQVNTDAGTASVPGTICQREGSKQSKAQ